MGVEKTFKNYWCIVHPNGLPLLYTFQSTRKYCIAYFMQEDSMTWAEYQKLGWSVKKVNVTITEV